MDDITKSPSISASELLDDTDFSTREMESNISEHNIFESALEFNDIIFIDENTNTIPPEINSKCYQAQGKAINSNKENNSNIAVQLMRENMKIKQEKLKIFKEKLLL